MKQPGTIDEYISSFPEDVQKILKKIRQTIKEEIPGAEETISYRIPAFKLGGKYVIYFAGFSNHVSLYPVSGRDISLEKELAPYLSGKGTVKFPLDKPVPLDLIRKITKLKLKDNMGRRR